jgi:hypothetical protein
MVVGNLVTRKPPGRISVGFLQTMAQGQWAEEKVRETINAHPSLTGIKYGQSRWQFKNKEEFIKYWERLHAQVTQYGKRPDILVFEKGQVSENLDLSERDEENVREIVEKSIAGLECRSSTWLLEKYKKSTGRDLNFTIKEEDLAVIKRWRETYQNKKTYYIQLFFDSSFALSFDEIVKILKTGRRKKDYNVEKEKKTGKLTYKIPISKGIKFANCIEEPTLCSETLTDEIGQVMAIRTPRGGKYILSEEFVNDLKKV